MFLNVKEFLFIFNVFHQEVSSFTNIAYNRQTSSSHPLYSIKSVPSLAVDGKDYNLSISTDEQCFISSNITRNGEPCWFAIDFGKTYFIPRMVFKLAVYSTIIRELNAHNSLYNATISMTEANPEVIVPMPTAPCERIVIQNSGMVTKFDTFCRKGNPIGRYLIVQQPINGTGYLNFCELEIYGMEYKSTSIFSRWKKFNNSRISRNWIGRPDTVRLIVVRSSLACLSICLSSFGTSCIALNYETVEQICMFAKFADPFPMKNSIADWVWIAPYGIGYSKDEANYDK